MTQILTVIAPLFLIIFASAAFQKFKGVDKSWNSVLNNFALNIGFPILIFSELSKASFSLLDEAPLIINNSVFMISCFIFAYIISMMLRLSKKMMKTLFITFAFGNVAYLGIPVLTQVAGPEILPTASLIVAIYLFWLFTIGISYLDYSTQKNKKYVIQATLLNIFKNPLLLAVIFGLIVSGLNIPIHDIIRKSLSMVSASVTPIVLIIIGLFIGSSKIGKISEWMPVFIFSLSTLMILPAGFYYSLVLLGHEPIQFSSSIIEAAMPLAITPFALAEKYGLNKAFIARSIVLSTILSVITLPFWVNIVI